MSNIYQDAAEKLIERIRAGTAPWQQPWKNREPPYNLVTGRPYRGGNRLMMMMSDYEDPRWCTYKQAQSMGAQVRKGERGTKILFCKTDDYVEVRDKDGSPVLGADGKPLVEKVKLARSISFPATVFNAEQIDGLPPLERKTPQWKPEERVENLMAALQVTVKHDRYLNQAFYRPSDDTIYLPERERFLDADGYYSTVLHEEAHATGHESRLNRDIKNPFGSEKYAREELRAEISSMMLGGECGLTGEALIDSHAAYVDSWCRILQNDPAEIYRAASDAEKICTYMLDLERKWEQEQQAEQTQAQVPEQIEQVKELSPYRVIASQSRVENVTSQTNVPTLTGGGHKDQEHQKLMKRWKENGDQTALDEAEAYARQLSRSEDAAERDKGNYILAKFHGDVTAAQYTVKRVLFGKQEVTKEDVKSCDVVKNLIQQLDGSKSVFFVPVLNKEGNRSNVLASEYANTLAEIFGGEVKTQIVKTSTAHGTNMGKAERTHLQPTFEVTDDVGRMDQVVLVDDQWTSGNTVLALWEKINETQNASMENSPVAAVATLSSSYRGIKPRPETLNKLMEVTNITEKEFSKEFGYDISDFTESRIQSALAEYNKHQWRDREHLSRFFPKLESGSRRDISGHVESAQGTQASRDHDRLEERERVVSSDPQEQDEAVQEKPERDRSTATIQAPVQEEREAEQRQKEIQDRQESPKRQYLAVPFEDNAEAKACGARWDAAAKCWYAPEDADRDKLQRWMPENLPVPVRQEPQEAFRAAMEKMGFELDELPAMDGVGHRARVEGDKEKEKSGFYVGYLDGRPAGYIKNNRTGQEMRWKSEMVISEQDRAIYQAQRAAKLAERAQNLAHAQEEASRRVQEQIKKLAQVESPTAYMRAKGIQPQNGVYTDRNGQTCIPMQDINGKIWSMQYIQPDGTKRLASGSRKEGCFHPVGGRMNDEDVAKSQAIIVCEGYATAASLKAATNGLPTIAAGDCGNLLHVAKALAEKYPDKGIIIAGDDDRETKGNPGRTHAEAAAKAVGGVAVFPIFATNERGKAFSDFNDLDQKSILGREGLKRQLRTAYRKMQTVQQSKMQQRQQQVERPQRQRDFSR